MNIILVDNPLNILLLFLQLMVKKPGRNPSVKLHFNNKESKVTVFSDWTESQTPPARCTNPCGGFVLCVSEGPSKFSPWSVFSFNQQKVSHKSVNKALKREKWVFTQFTVWLHWGRERRTVGTSFDKETQMMTLYNLSCVYKADRKQESTHKYRVFLMIDETTHSGHPAIDCCSKQANQSW